MSARERPCSVLPTTTATLIKSILESSPTDIWYDLEQMTRDVHRRHISRLAQPAESRCEFPSPVCSPSPYACTSSRRH